MAVHQIALSRLFDSHRVINYLSLQSSSDWFTADDAAVVARVGPATVTVGGKPYWSQAALDAWIVANANT